MVDNQKTKGSELIETKANYCYSKKAMVPSCLQQIYFLYAVISNPNVFTYNHIH